MTGLWYLSFAVLVPDITHLGFVFRDLHVGFYKDDIQRYDVFKLCSLDFEFRKRHVSGLVVWVLGSEITFLAFNIVPPLPLGSEVRMIYSYNTPDLGFGL